MLHKFIIFGLLAPSIVGYFFLYIEDRRKLRELIAILKALKIEFQFNCKSRGTSIYEYKDYWLKEAISKLEFHEHSKKEFYKNCLNILEHIHNENSDKNKTKNNARPLMEKEKNNIDATIKTLEKHITLSNYLWWKYKKKFSKMKLNQES